MCFIETFLIFPPPIPQPSQTQSLIFLVNALQTQQKPPGHMSQGVGTGHRQRKAMVTEAGALSGQRATRSPAHTSESPGMLPPSMPTAGPLSKPEPGTGVLGLLRQLYDMCIHSQDNHAPETCREGKNKTFKGMWPHLSLSRICSKTWALDGGGPADQLWGFCSRHNGLGLSTGL